MGSQVSRILRETPERPFRCVNPLSSQAACGHLRITYPSLLVEILKRPPLVCFLLRLLGQLCDVFLNHYLEWYIELVGSGMPLAVVCLIVGRNR